MRASEGSLLERVIVITGGGGGIGGALAKNCLRRGARVALLDLDAERLERARTELGGGERLMAAPCDVTSPVGCQAAIGAVVARWGGVDVLVNNAGAVHRSGFCETDVAVLRRVMEVNYFGSVHCTKAALPSLLERRGSIVVVSSIAGVAPLYGRSGYAASKHALHGLFESLRAELSERGVRVLMVCPSFTESGFEARALGAHGERIARPRSKVGHVSSPDEVAEAIVRGMLRKRRLLVLSPVGKLSYLMSRLAPALYERLMRKSLESELRR